MRNRRWLVPGSTLLLVAMLTAGTAPGARPAQAGQPSASSAHGGVNTSSANPNIIVFYLDDAAPHDARLWDDPNRTPALYNTFIAHGIDFTNAIGETPLCCPGRAALLTGLHAHNNGVGANDARLFSPQETVAKELDTAGYTTMWIGKYMNRNQWQSPAAWAAQMAPWSVFDVLYGDATFYDFTMRTKDQGDVYYPNTHSSQVLMDRAVSRLQAAPADKPVFAVFSSYDIHLPNTAMPQPPEKMAMCDSMQPWWTPNYNEADVSDKPAYVRAAPLLPNHDGWPMQQYCREMFAFDDLVQRVTDELQTEGRLDNTLLVFTADNGMAWGAHRLQNKAVPYATPVPLYMAWPARWGSTPRTISEYVSNIDLAPTFCAAGGCTLGPYPTGQTHPDGLSLLDLVDNGTSLGRDALLEQMPVQNGKKGGPTWAAVRTTSESQLGLWHYVEYVTGERELYDLQADPYELNNRAGDPSYAAVQAALATRLNQLLGEGRVTRPDLSAWSTVVTKRYAGYNRYNDGPAANSTITEHGRVGSHFKYEVDLRNNELNSDSFRLTASATGSNLTIEWKVNGSVVTSSVVNGGLVLSIPARTTVPLKLHVTMAEPFPKGSSATIQVHVASTGDAALDDHLTFVFGR